MRHPEGTGVGVDPVTGAGVAERMLVALARCVRDGTLVAQGVNSVLPSLAIALAKRTHAPQAVALNIGGGVDVLPSPVPASSAAPQWMAGTAAIVSNPQLYTHLFRGRVDLFFASGVQIDARGRINLSVIGEHARPKVRLPGAGGLPAIFQVVRRVVLWRTRHTPRIFVEAVDFVSAVGNIEQVVSPLGVFRMHQGRLALAQLFPGVDEADVRARTGFGFETVPGGPNRVSPPTEAELATIAAMDPHGHRYLEFEAA